MTEVKGNMNVKIRFSTAVTARRGGAEQTFVAAGYSNGSYFDFQADAPLFLCVKLARRCG